MSAETTPIHGCNQPALGWNVDVTSFSVGRPKSNKVVTPAARKLRAAVGENLKRLVAEEWPGKSLTFGYERIKESTGFSLSTLQRIAAGKVGCEIDTLADIAKALGHTAAELCDQSAHNKNKEVPAEPKPIGESRRRLHGQPQAD